jgi:3-oxoacyl-[acyl-carrier protein] reductase
MISIDLAGRLALVTGATGELGRAMVRTLARAGADVAVHYRDNRQQAEILVAEIEALGRRALAVQADVAEKSAVERMRAEVGSALGAPDIVVANAVTQYEWTSVLKQSVADYESQFRSCVLHAVLLAQAFVPAMIEKGRGRIIGINTECVMQCWPKQSAYVAGKRGMDGVFRVLAKEVGEHGITVNQVAPGWTISENRPEADGAKWYSDQVPLKRRGTAQEIANVVAFLASDLAGFISGAYLPVCGGSVMPAI